ncbi:hypothetical protein ACWGI8_02605 [Streptomyces sp. NPDC054841]
MPDQGLALTVAIHPRAVVRVGDLVALDEDVSGVGAFEDCRYRSPGPHKLSQLLREQAWREPGLGAPDDVEQLKLRITTLKQQVVDLKLQLEERTEELQAARATNRDLITRLNR